MDLGSLVLIDSRTFENSNIIVRIRVFLFGYKGLYFLVVSRPIEDPWDKCSETGALARVHDTHTMESLV